MARAERILAEYADTDGLVGALKGFRRPLHELCEVKQKRGLYLILVNGSLSSDTCPHGPRKNGQGEAQYPISVI